MGSSESVPRNIVIDKEKGILDGYVEPTFIKVHHVQQEHVHPRSEHVGSELISEQEFQDLKKSYDEKIRVLQEKNAELYGATVDNFSRAVERAEDKFMNSLQPSVCGEAQSKLLVCLKANSDKLLNCSPVIDDFNFCMQKYRSHVSWVA